MEDNQILSHIKSLTSKEEELYAKENLSDEDVANLHKMQKDLDQCWDYLRQRRALRDAGSNPDNAKIRSNDVIDNYEE